MEPQPYKMEIGPLKEYDEPCLSSQDVTWSDEDGDLAQAID